MILSNQKLLFGYLVHFFGVDDEDDEKTKAQSTPRHGSSTTKTTIQGVSDTDKNIKEEVK
jgi:hypothetical protein